MYLVKWSGYEGTDKETSWLLANALGHASKIISKFHRRYPANLVLFWAPNIYPNFILFFHCLFYLLTNPKPFFSTTSIPSDYHSDPFLIPFLFTQENQNARKFITVKTKILHTNIIFPPLLLVSFTVCLVIWPQTNLLLYFLLLPFSFISTSLYPFFFSIFHPLPPLPFLLSPLSLFFSPSLCSFHHSLSFALCTLYPFWILSTLLIIPFWSSNHSSITSIILVKASHLFHSSPVSVPTFVLGSPPQLFSVSYFIQLCCI